MFNKSAAALALLIASGNLEATSGFQVVTPNVSTRLIANIQTQTCNAFREPFSLHATQETINERSQDGVKKHGVKSFFTATLASLAMFLTLDEVAMQTYSNHWMQANGLASSIVANADELKKDIPAPPVTAPSSDRALRIGEDLKSLDAKMFGAYWCSHCYEQKQRLGKEAFANVEYNECAKEGLNSKTDMCKAKKVPGYPTWEINGKLFPGDMYLDELEDIIKAEKKSI